MANENKTAKEYVQKGYLIAHLANCGIRTINYDEWERLCECIHEAKPADVEEVVRCKDCLFGHRCFQVIHGISDSWVECQNPDGLNRTVSDNGFCSASIERREDGEIH